jgi:hypothetical protein
MEFREERNTVTRSNGSFSGAQSNGKGLRKDRVQDDW